jgi:transcription-repair coupling factor (superfamily II helicase)
MRSFNPQTLETLDRHTMAVILPRRVHTKISAEVPFEAFIDVKEGDYLVHLDHGIGRYLGRTTIDPSTRAKALSKGPSLGVVPSERSESRDDGAAGPQDALIVEYADGDRLYVPIDQLHLVQKYVAFGGRTPSLHTLGGTAWQRAKTKAYLSAWTYAKTLLEVEAKRRALPGFAFPNDHEWQRQFERAFAHRETPDQLTATRDIKRDLEQPQPMDRLLLGDVGYGKTEVAIRAAFKAVMANKQVAVLVPTTILAYQHYRTFTARMEPFPVQVRMLSRFQSEAQQRQILEALASGECNIVIGTHRLLSGDVRFKELGLLIVDEEQRFGVKVQELLKQWRTHLDVLTLSATPIPRTLYLSMVGARDMSLIMTPPENRHPVETEVIEEDEGLLQHWIRRELVRDGQVFVVHDRVQTIHRVAKEIQALAPEARVGVAHGQLHEQELEQVMIEFMEGRLDVLVATTIIESGIDIPNANTLIVTRADRFGLADLYQLRGRVGRFTRKAYAYFVVPKRATLTAEARKRLKAMADHTALGSGFKIAMEDLKIRGAGNLLGVEQSGHISAVGFDLYCRLLREVVAHLKTQQHHTTEPQKIHRGPETGQMVRKCGGADVRA